MLKITDKIQQLLCCIPQYFISFTGIRKLKNAEKAAHLISHQGTTQKKTAAMAFSVLSLLN